MPNSHPLPDTPPPAPQTCNPDTTLCPRAHCFPLLLLFILLAVIYAGSFRGTWMFDDGSNIVENSRVHMKSLDWPGIRETFQSIRGKSFDRPFAYLTFGLNHCVHGLDTWGYHLVNFGIHCLATLFLYLFVFRTLHLPMLRERYADRAGSVALLAATLWATHPIQVTSVTYIVQRMASMSAMFFILSMLCYLMGRVTPRLPRKIAWFLLCFSAGFLSLASKENAVMLPAILYVFDVLLIQGVTRKSMPRQLLTGLIPLALLAGIAFAVADPSSILSGYDVREFTLWERLLTQPRILLFYLSLVLYPMTDRFTLIYEVQLSTSLFTPWTTFPAIAFWAAWTGLGIFLAGRGPLIAFCLLFFVINHIMESSFIPLELIYEHRNYLPSMTLFLLMSVGIIAFLRDFTQSSLLRGLAVALVVITLAGQGHTVIKRNALFEHPLYMWHDNAEKSPGLSRVHNNLGRTYEEMGLSLAARDAYLKAIEVNRYPLVTTRELPLLNLADNYLEGGEPETALEYYRQAIHMGPTNWMVWYGTAKALLQLDEPAQAKSVLEFTLAHEARKAPLHALYGFVLLKEGAYREAIEAARRALALDARSSLALKVLGEAHMQVEDYIQARKFWQDYAANDPQDLEALLALLQLAHYLGDEMELRRTAVHVLTMKQGRNWGDWIEDLKNRPGHGFLVHTADPKMVIPLVKDGVELELKEGRQGH